MGRKENLMNIENKKAVITGGASGIGKAIAEALVAKGCTLVLVDLDSEAVDATAAELGEQVSARTCNVRDVAAVDQLAKECWDEIDGVDLVFANAGIGPGAPMLEATAEQFDVIYEVNVRGSWATCAAFARLMAAEGRPGHLCVTGSEHSLGMPHPMLGHYTSSKHAVLGWADVMRVELPDHIGISILCPGIVKTKLYDGTRNTELAAPDEGSMAMGKALMEKGMDAEDVARTCLQGISDGAFFIPTHASARHASERRWQEVDAAFAKYAPAGSDSEKYEMNELMAGTMAEFGVEEG